MERRMSKLDVLFVGDKWACNDPDRGPAMHQDWIVGPLDSTELANIRMFYYEEPAYQGWSVDEALLEACATLPELIVCHYSIGFPFLPKVETFAALRERGVPIVFIWYDMVYWPNPKTVDETLAPISSVNVVLDVDGYPTRYPDKYLNLWGPHDPRVYHDPGLDRTISVSHVGSVDTFPRRGRTLAALRERGVEVATVGGMGVKHDRRVPSADYTRVLQQSKLSLNFSWASEGAPPDWYPVMPDQVKGRVFEILSCGAMLLESENAQIRRFFVPYEHYVPWSDEADLADKIRYYLAHEDERRRIAENGHRKAVEEFSAERFWTRVLERIGLAPKGRLQGEKDPATAS
jgi:hypothetical protein